MFVGTPATLWKSNGLDESGWIWIFQEFQINYKMLTGDSFGMPSIRNISQSQETFQT